MHTQLFFHSFVPFFLIFFISFISCASSSSFLLLSFLQPQVKVEYETFPGWKCDISKARLFEDLPPNAQKYLKRVEQLTKVPVSWVGVGAGRLDMATQGFKA